MNGNHEPKILEYLSLLGPSHEWIISNRNHINVIINAYTADEFHPFWLAPEDNRKEAREFELRQQYSLPNTPKIIIVKNQHHLESETMVLVQRGQFPIDKLFYHLQTSIRGQLELTLQIINASQMLHKKYGCFEFTSSMIKASKGPTFLIWISENEISNYPQIPIAPVSPLILTKGVASKQIASPMHNMLKSLLKILNKYLNFCFMQDFMQMNEGLNFDLVKQRIVEELQDQSSSQCTIFNLTNVHPRGAVKERRKIPDFLLNRIPQKHQKYDSCLVEEPNNQQSDIIYSNFRSETLKDIKNALEEKVGKSKVLKQKSFNEKEKENCVVSLLLKNNHKKKKIFDNVFEASRDDSIGLKMKKDKNYFHESKKTISTSSACFSGKSGQKNSSQNNCSTEEDVINNKSYLLKSFGDKVVPSFGKINIKVGLSQTIETFKEEKKNVSKIIEEKKEEFQKSLSILTPRTCEAFITNFGSNTTMTQQSIASPGSEFYKDVEELLRSKTVSRTFEDEFSKAMEVELNNILM